MFLLYFNLISEWKREEKIRVKFQLQRRCRKNCFFFLFWVFTLIYLEFNSIVKFVQSWRIEYLLTQKKVAIYWTLAFIEKLFSFVFIGGVWIQWKSNGDDLLFTYMDVFLSSIYVILNTKARTHSFIEQTLLFIIIIIHISSQFFFFCHTWTSNTVIHINNVCLLFLFFLSSPLCDRVFLLVWYDRLINESALLNTCIKFLNPNNHAFDRIQLTTLSLITTTTAAAVIFDELIQKSTRKDTLNCR